jgi:hypothetical protein
MARTYKRDSRGRFAGGGGSSSRGGGRKQMQRGTNRLTRDNAGRITSVGGDGATARGGRLRTASGKQRATVTAKGIGKAPAGTVGRSGKVKGAARVKAAAAAKPTRKLQLEAGAKRSRAQADKIDAKVTKLEKEYRSKDSAFYTQGVKPAGRDRMIAKSQQAAKLREESAALRRKANNAERMARKIKDKPVKPTTSSNPRMQRALRNEAAGSTSFRRDPKGYTKRVTALTAQKIYKTGDVTAGLSVRYMAGKGFRLPRSQRANTAAKPAATAKPASKLGFTQSDFARRSQRTASIRNPQVKAKAQQLYGKILDLNSTPRQLKSMFKKAGKPKQRTATAATRQMRREHQNMMAASKVLFK